MQSVIRGFMVEKPKDKYLEDLKAIARLNGGFLDGDSDPDAGLELRPEVVKRLKESAKQAKVGNYLSLGEIKKKLNL